MIAAASHILITGATGNIGIEVLKSLQKSNHQLQVVAGVRNLKAMLLNWLVIQLS